MIFLVKELGFYLALKSLFVCPHILDTLFVRFIAKSHHSFLQLALGGFTYVPGASRKKDLSFLNNKIGGFV
ncbi:hypothetical protein N836_17510 [Leptolyngbya sp. Heron Island J]|nr:hypothetical protein N836_17510 [Leptolyngbya sp. Heron Island J]